MIPVAKGQWYGKFFDVMTLSLFLVGYILIIPAL